MGCCGQKRAQVRAAERSRDARPPAGASDPAQGAARESSGSTPVLRPGDATGAIVIRYRGRAHVMVDGPVTGAQYEFSGQRPLRRVDGRDAVALLRTPYFEAGAALD